MRLALSRRALATCLAAAITIDRDKVSAASSCSQPVLLNAKRELEAATELLPDKSRWGEAFKILSALDSNALERALEICVDAKSLKDQAMNNAAFIVYYEERRYNDVRLEPKTPSSRAEQNGARKEFLRALSDTKLELAFLVEQSKSSESESDADLRAYARAANKALEDFIALLPSPT